MSLKNKTEKMKKEKKLTKKEIKWLTKGLELDDIGKSREAIECYDKALEINPKHSDAWYNKAQLLEDNGKFNEAIQCYYKSLENNPNFEFSKDVLKCYFKAVEINGAKELLFSYVERYSNKPWGELEKLIELLEKKYKILINKEGLEKLLDFIKDQINNEKKKNDYDLLKKIILSEKPSNKEEYVDAFLNHYDKKFDDKLGLLKNFLDDSDVKLTLSDLKKLIQQRKALKELETYEKEILGNKILNEEDKFKLNQLKKRLNKWKKEGYNIEELENIFREYEK